MAMRHPLLPPLLRGAMFLLALSFPFASWSQETPAVPELEEFDDFDDFEDEAPAPASPYHAPDFFGFIEAVLTARLDNYTALRGSPLEGPEESPTAWVSTLTHPAVRSTSVDAAGFHAVIGQYPDRAAAETVMTQLGDALTHFILSFSPLTPTTYRQLGPVPPMESAAWKSPRIDGYQIYYAVDLDGDFVLPEGGFVPRRVYLVRLHIANLR